MAIKNLNCLQIFKVQSVNLHFAIISTIFPIAKYPLNACAAEKNIERNRTNMPFFI